MDRMDDYTLSQDAELVAVHDSPYLVFEGPDLADEGVVSEGSTSRPAGLHYYYY